MIRTESISNKDYSAQVTSEANDLGTGAPIVPTAILGYSPLLLWYKNLSAGYFKNFPEGARVLAQDTGRIWNVGVDNLGDKAIYLVTTGSASAQPAPLRGLIFVDAAASPGGNGSITTPYNNLQTALNAALANTTIELTAGVYVGDFVMPNVEGIEIMGCGQGQTILRNATDSHTFAWIRAGVVPAIARFSMRNLTVENNAATASNSCIHFDANGETPNGPGQQNAFLTDGGFFTNVDCRRKNAASGRTAFFRRAGNIQWDYCDWRGDVGVAGAVVTANLGRGTCFQTFFSNIDNEWLRSNPIPFAGRNAFTMAAGSAVAVRDNVTPTLQGGVILRGHPIFITDQTCAISGSTGVPAIQGIGLTTTNGSGGVGPAAALILQVAATIGSGSSTAGSGSVNLPLPAFPAGFAIPIVDFSRSQFIVLPAAAGSFTVTAATGSITTQLVSMNQARLVFLSALGAPVAGAISVGSATAGINNPVNLDVRGAFYYSQSTFSVATGSFLDRSSWSQAVASFPTVATATTISPPFPAGSTYTVSPETTTPVSVGISSKTNSSVTIQASASGASGNLQFTRT